MAYEWKFNPRPYSDAEAKELLKDVVSVETTDWHYNTHHKGYVTFLNNIEKELEGADRSKANGNYSQIGELKRRFTWNHGAGRGGRCRQPRVAGAHAHGGRDGEVFPNCPLLPR